VIKVRFHVERWRTEYILAHNDQKDSSVVIETAKVTDVASFTMEQSIKEHEKFHTYRETNEINTYQ
jgi:hypothetical protein